MPIRLKHLEFQATTGTTAQFTAVLTPGNQYYIKGNIDFFVSVGATGVAALADGTAGHERVTAGVLWPVCNIIDTGSTTTNGFVNVISDGVSGDVDLFQEVPGTF